MALNGTTANFTATMSGWTIAITAGDGSGSVTVNTTFDQGHRILQDLQQDDQRGAGMLATIRSTFNAADPNAIQPF